MLKDKEFAVLGFGEVMLRLSPQGQERIAQGNSFVKHAGGSELNVVSAIARLGVRTGLMTSLPGNLVGQFIRSKIRSYGVSDDYVLSDISPEARLGIYYYEGGSFPRKPHVVYDRGHTSFKRINADDIPEAVYNSTSIFHTSGISLALMANANLSLVDIIKSFKQKGVMISFDVNYRANLWSEEAARAAVAEILPYIDILFVSEETSRRAMQRTGTLAEIQKGYCSEYGVSVVASTKRIVNSPKNHTFDSILYSAAEDNYYFEAPYENIDVVDRIGSGDAYVAGVLYALHSGLGYAEAVSYGNAVSAVKNTVPGDILSTDLREIKDIIAGHRKIGPVSEMNR